MFKTKSMYEKIKISDSVKEQFDLKGKSAIITGGAGFLGIQFSETIAEMNGKPILIDINEDHLREAAERLKKSNYRNFSTSVLDISNEKNCISVYNEIWDKNNGIDILINCAALTKSGLENSDKDFFADFEDLDQDLWDYGLAVNLTATQISCKILGSMMAKKGVGNIVNIASDVGIVSPNHNIYIPDEHGYDGVNFNSPAFYAVSKAGVIHLTKYLAAYWAKRNVRVNSISPAGVYRKHDKGFVKKLSEQIPMGRMALPNEFKGAIAYLSSNASSFVTGHNLVIDGGRTIW
jgi:NAD(P)-dependent dehydrogenase (short-subunit alcohol dehydrogenase family)